MRYTVRPISDRTPFGGSQEPTPFRATWAQTLELLEVELDHLAARNVVLEVDVRDDRQIRLDGMLRVDAKVDSPAVRIAFDSRHGPLTYATDRYAARYSDEPADWQQNVRAIALALEALRKVDRYGVTKRGEQYAGWKALPSGRAMPSASMTEREAEAVFGRWSGETVWLTEDNAKVYRRARANAHPDRNGGDRTGWDQVERAAAVFGLVG